MRFEGESVFCVGCKVARCYGVNFQCCLTAKSMLNRMGHEVVLSGDGVEAVRLFQESIKLGTPFDLVIMDLTIPGGMGGKEAVEEILKIDHNAKVIVASGYSNDPIMANYKDYGFCAAIVKPFQMQDLTRGISQALD